MDKIKHRGRHADYDVPWPQTYHAVMRPYPDQLPELDAIGHSTVSHAEPSVVPTFEPRSMFGILIPRRGGQRIRINGRWFNPTGGEMLIIPPYANIAFGRELITRIEGYDLYLNLHDKRPFFDSKRYEPLREQLLQLPATQSVTPPRAIESMRDIYDRLTSSEKDNAMLVPWLTLKLGTLLMDVLETLQRGATHKEPDYLQTAQQYMIEHLHESLGLTDIVEHTGYSRTALIEAFRRHRGVPPMEWFLKLKIDHACMMLSKTDQPITKLAMQLGFTSSQYFATVFKRFLSLTPSQYRKQSRPIP